MMPREAPTGPPDGSKMANMRPRCASKSSPSELRDGDMAKREQALEDRETFVAARELALAKRECAVKKIPNVPPGSAPSGFQEWSQRRWVERTHTHAHADTPTHAHTHARTFMHATKFECEEEAKVFRPRQ